MTLKTHIAAASVVSLALIALIACQETKKENVETKKSEAVPEIAEEVITEFEKATDKTASEEQISETSVKETVSEYTPDVTEKKEEPKNLLLNSNFADGLAKWNYQKNVKAVKIDDKTCVEIIGTTNSQMRLWQSVSTVSGHVYRLSFDVKAEQNVAFAIFRDDDTEEERYLYTSPKEGWKKYEKDFQSYKDGKYRVFLSCFGFGNFYFSNVSLTDKTDTIKK